MRTTFIFGLLTCYALHDTDWMVYPGLTALGITASWITCELTIFLKRKFQ